MSASVVENKIRSFRDLQIWQMGVGLVERVYQVTENFPGSEKYGLVNQMQRSAVAIPSNIAEGFRRRHPKEYKQFLGIALGSCGELETQAEIAKRLGYVDPATYDGLIETISSICKMTHSLIKKIG